MRLNDPRLQEALRGWRASHDPKRRAEADNIWFEERVSAARQAAFEERAAGADDADRLRRGQVDYWQDFVQTEPGDPHTFLAEFGPADLGPLDPHQWIVRLESLDRPLRGWEPQGDWAERFKKLVGARDAGNAAAVEKFVEGWNLTRDHRPAFAAFADQLEDELREPDWPHRLRDRLGLAHYDGAAAPIPVALMRYRVDEVQKAAVARALGCAFTAPTVLDSGPWPWFFPAPAGLNYGRTMSLFAVEDDSQLVAEILHPRIAYRPEHIARLGVIREPLPHNELKTLRNHHLLAIQLVSSREDFGEAIP